MAASGLAQIEALGDEELASTDAKRREYARWQESEAERGLRAFADIKVAQYFLPIIEGQGGSATTEGAFRSCLRGEGKAERLMGYPAARVIGEGRRFFHWFAEFPTVFDAKHAEGGGFDVVIGNPPFLGGQKLSGTYGNDYLAWLKSAWPPAGAMDLVGFFFRRNFDLLKRN